MPGRPLHVGNQVQTGFVLFTLSLVVFDPICGSAGVPRVMKQLRLGCGDEQSFATASLDITQNLPFLDMLHCHAKALFGSTSWKLVPAQIRARLPRPSVP
jgi:hypothetical protein